MSTAVAEKIDHSDMVARLVEDPGCYPKLDYMQGFELDRDAIEEIHLAGVKKRFENLRDRIAVLRKMSEEQGIHRIEKLDDVVPLLFPHTMYKSYPLSYIEKSRFDRLTKWFQGLTTIDLGKCNLDGIDTIDGWIRCLDESTEMQLIHTSGTTGKLSFLPRARKLAEDRFIMLSQIIRDWHGRHTGPDLLAEPRPVIYPSYRYGSSAQHRGVDVIFKLFAKTEENLLCLYPSDAFSADVASLAGRLRAAEEKGEQGALDLAPGLLNRRDEFLRREGERGERLEHFFAEAERRFKGRDVLVFSMWPMLYDWAVAGRERGFAGLFGPNSVVQSGGGNKGRDLPDNARDIIVDFLGFDNMVEFYGMSEMSGNCRKCEHGNYHIPPFTVPFVLDPDTGEAMPREGFQTGRFAFLDLLPETSWGGFISGDKVTVGWCDVPCDCGRTGPYLKGEIQRFSELQGGDDKISCAGAPAAQDRAIQFLAELGS